MHVITACEAAALQDRHGVKMNALANAESVLQYATSLTHVIRACVASAASDPFALDPAHSKLKPQMGGGLEQRLACHRIRQKAHTMEHLRITPPCVRCTSTSRRIGRIAPALRLIDSDGEYQEHRGQDG